MSAYRLENFSRRGAGVRAPIPKRRLDALREEAYTEGYLAGQAVATEGFLDGAGAADDRDDRGHRRRAPDQRGGAPARGGEPGADGRGAGRGDHAGPRRGGAGRGDRRHRGARRRARARARPRLRCAPEVSGGWARCWSARGSMPTVEEAPETPAAGGADLLGPGLRPSRSRRLHRADRACIAVASRNGQQERG